MIYLDSSVVLAHLFDEQKRPSAEFWEQRITSSRLLEYEIWNRLHAYGQADSARSEIVRLLRYVTLVEMSVDTLARALLPFSPAIRTLDALHLATMEFLRGDGQIVELASYDSRLNAAAEALGFKKLSHLLRCDAEWSDRDFNRPLAQALADYALVDQTRD